MTSPDNASQTKPRRRPGSRTIQIVRLRYCVSSRSTPRLPENEVLTKVSTEVVKAVKEPEFGEQLKNDRWYQSRAGVIAARRSMMV